MAAPSVVLHVARHGETALNAQNRFRGTADVPLNPAGQKAAETLGRHYAKQPILAIAHTGRKRTEQTADTIAAAHAEPAPHTGPIEALRAWDFGDFSGKEKTPENLAELKQYVEQPEKPVPGGESLNQFRERVRPALREAIQAGQRTGKPPLLVVHASVIHELGQMLNGDDQSVLVHPGGTVEVRRDNAGHLAAVATSKKEPVDGKLHGVVS